MFSSDEISQYEFESNFDYNRVNQAQPALSNLVDFEDLRFGPIFTNYPKSKDVFDNMMRTICLKTLTS